MELCRAKQTVVNRHSRSRPLRLRWIKARRAIALLPLLAWLGPAWAYVEPPFVTNPPAIEARSSPLTSAGGAAMRSSHSAP